MPIVHIEMWKGRSSEQKQKLAEVITENMESIMNMRPESIQIIFNEVEKESWAIGGKLGGKQQK